MSLTKYYGKSIAAAWPGVNSNHPPLVGSIHADERSTKKARTLGPSRIWAETVRFTAGHNTVRFQHIGSAAQNFTLMDK